MVTAAQSRLRASPFVKWAGGKGQLLSALIPLMPDSFGTYFEPFLGGGAVFYALTPPTAVLGDFNEELINCYRVIRDLPDALMTTLDTHVYDRDYYYHVRSIDPATLSNVERAARFIYLNKTCFNGLYRVNRKGQFNVPFGKYASPPRLYDPDNIRSVSNLLQNVTLLSGDYRTTLATAREGDFIYLDPPYHPLSQTAQFTNYTQDDFHEADQRLLAGVFKELDERGCLVMLSNSATPLIRELYEGYDTRVVLASRAINSNGARRGACAELVIRNYPRRKPLPSAELPGSNRNLERWEQVITKNKIDLTAPVSYISADAIRKASGIDARLMAKIDRREDLPAVFRRHNVFILPVKNGLYALVHGDGYHELDPPCSAPLDFASQIAFKLHTVDTGLSEMQYLDFAYSSGLLEHFAGSGQMYPTIRGRKYSPAFRFVAGSSPELEARSVQVEVDAGYESRDNIIIVEGKIGTPSNFIVKQLYYPYRFWQTIVPEKAVLPVFFCYDPAEQVYHFWLYRFTDPHDYCSVELVRQQSYRISQRVAPLLAAEELPVMKQDPGMIIPQADDVRKLLELPFKIAEGMASSAELASYFEFDRRQSRYYRQAVEALGLLTVQNEQYRLSELGEQYVRLDVPRRNEFFARLMLKLPVMHEIFTALMLHPQQRLNRDEIASIIQRHSTLSGNTLHRRAATVLAWFRWMQRSLGVVRVEDTTLILLGNHHPYQLSLL